ncbi:HlyD family efflux transporter periplasmic adaptor subunit [Breoghania sp. L-A4]|uniref:efflux RND transporter periplasmic adaptor subunit n=1 Tax=Breoghania sp. L-A4 TaxID=2304600 RepID=UPI000E35E6C5|nr:HlyD family efflux transporter periplasmic adaptor subunit [Breoghania sp. L-A4]AXS41389.1 HlyD family efflux transporter periplasmic adaptor subunit [Breoghania sp. L-A4]
MSITLRRLILWGILALLVALGIAYALWPRPVPVDLARIDRGPLTVSIDEEAETRIRDIYEVSAPVTGRVLRITLEVGDDVVANQTIIAQLQPIDPAFLDLRTEAEMRAALQAAEAARDLAQANVARARAELAFAETDRARIRQLAETETASRRQLDQAELTYDTRQAELATAQATLDMRMHELERARAQLIPPGELIDQRDGCACVPVQAPIDGKILRLMQTSEGVINAGATIAEIGDPRNLEVVTDLLSADAVRVEPGLAVIIDDWGGEAPLSGVVRRVEPFGFTKVSALGIEEQRVKVVIDLTDPPGAYARLAHGFRVETSIVLWRGEDVLVLPLTALFRKDGAWTVFAVRDGRAHATEVRIGHANGLQVEVLEGLGEGDTVVVHPANQIADGTRVAARQQE